MKTEEKENIIRKYETYSHQKWYLAIPTFIDRAWFRISCYSFGINNSGDTGIEKWDITFIFRVYTGLMIGCEVFPASNLVINCNIAIQAVSVHQHWFNNQDVLIIGKLTCKQNPRTTRHYLLKFSHKPGSRIIGESMRMTSDQKWLEVVSLFCQPWNCWDCCFRYRPVNNWYNSL